MNTNKHEYDCDEINKKNAFMLYLPLILIACGFVVLEALVVRGGILSLLLPLLFWSVSFFTGLFNIFRLSKERNSTWKKFFSLLCIVLALLLVLFGLLQPLIIRLVYNYTNH